MDYENDNTNPPLSSLLPGCKCNNNNYQVQAPILDLKASLEDIKPINNTTLTGDHVDETIQNIVDLFYATNK